MSSYTTSSPTYVGLLSDLRAAMPEMEHQARAICQGLTSAQLAEVIGELRTVELRDPADLADVWDRADRALPDWQTVFSDATRQQLSSSRSSVESLLESTEALAPAFTNGALIDVVTALESAAEEVAGYELALTAQADLDVPRRPRLRRRPRGRVPA